MNLTLGPRKVSDPRQNASPLVSDRTIPFLRMAPGVENPRVQTDHTVQSPEHLMPSAAAGQECLGASLLPEVHLILVEPAAPVNAQITGRFQSEHPWHRVTEQQSLPVERVCL